MSIAHGTPGDDKSPQESTHNPAHATIATLRAAARDSQVTRAALAVLIELHTPSNEWRSFTVKDLASALMLSRETIQRSLALLSGQSKRGRKMRRYIEERPTYRAHGEREARLTPLPVPNGAPGAAR